MGLGEWLGRGEPQNATDAACDATVRIKEKPPTPSLESVASAGCINAKTAESRSPPPLDGDNQSSDDLIVVLSCVCFRVMRSSVRPPVTGSIRVSVVMQIGKSEMIVDVSQFIVIVPWRDERDIFR